MFSLLIYLLSILALRVLLDLVVVLFLLYLGVVFGGTWSSSWLSLVLDVFFCCFLLGSHLVHIWSVHNWHSI